MSTRDNRFTPQLTALASKPAKHARTKRRPAAGVTSLRGIARALNDRGISAPRGHGWQATQVRRLLARLAG
jgi:Recombinase